MLLRHGLSTAISHITINMCMCSCVMPLASLVSSCHCSSRALMEHHVPLLLQLVKGDIQSMDLLNFLLTAEEIDTIMHFAAQVSLVGKTVLQLYRSV